jgi:hypothetical protein
MYVVFIVCSVSFIICIVFCVICVLCLIEVPLSPGKNPFAVIISSNKNTVAERKATYHELVFERC